MLSPSDSQTLCDDLLMEVDFKWLMAGKGYWVDTRRLHNDSVYAHSCAEHARSSHSPELLRLANTFDTVPPARIFSS